jgi:hypothetical protein
VGVGTMNTEQFIEAIRTVVEIASVEDSINVLLDPPGRSPSPDLLALSDWYRGLSDHDRSMLSQAMHSAVKMAIFGFFCVLDGVRAVEDDREKGKFELLFRKGQSVTRLNPPDREYLHDIYNSA